MDCHVTIVKSFIVPTFCYSTWPWAGCSRLREGRARLLAAHLLADAVALQLVVNPAAVDVVKLARR
jgi:hypothetical protein